VKSLIFSVDFKSLLKTLGGLDHFMFGEEITVQAENEEQQAR
jgi:hypothetical protein